MKARAIILILIATFACSNLFAQQARAYDSTMKLGKAGYRVRCNNKKPDKNNLTIGTIGFESSATRDFDVEIKGRINNSAASQCIILLVPVGREADLVLAVPLIRSPPVWFLDGVTFCFCLLIIAKHRY